MHSPRESAGEIVATADIAAGDRDATAVKQTRAGRKGIGLWPLSCAISSLVLLIMIISPLLICIWGSFTTLTVMGTSSERGAGWEGVTTSKAGRTQRRRRGNDTDLGVCQRARHISDRLRRSGTNKWWRFGKTMRLSLMLANQHVSASCSACSAAFVLSATGSRQEPGR